MGSATLVGQPPRVEDTFPHKEFRGHMQLGAPRASILLPPGLEMTSLHLMTCENDKVLSLSVYHGSRLGAPHVHEVGKENAH